MDGGGEAADQHQIPVDQWVRRRPRAGCGGRCSDAPARYSRDAAVVVAHGQRGTLSLSWRTVARIRRPGLPADLIGGEPHDQGRPARVQVVFGDLHPRHEQPRAGQRTPSPCVELVGVNGDRDVPGAVVGPVSGISGAPGDPFGQGVGAALPRAAGAFIRAGGVAYTSNAAASASPVAASNSPLRIQGVVQPRDRSTGGGPGRARQIVVGPPGGTAG